MTDNIVVFPSFADPQQVRPYEMRQLVSALEARFRGLEQNQTISIGGTELDLDDLDDRYAAASHTHVIADITDFGSYLENIESESIFDLSDVAGSPSNNDTLVWNASTSRFEPVALTLDGSALNDLTDVDAASPSDGDVLTWVDSANEWQAVAATSGTDFLQSSDEIVPVHQLGLTYSLFWGQALARMEMFNDAAATTGGFWFNFQSGHNEPSIRIGQASDTDFQFEVDAGAHIYNGGYLRIYDASDADYLQLDHDGTDANLDFVGATDLNITNLTSIQAGTVNADFDAITATSYGGILEANLLDKAATETVTGDWTFSGTTVVPEATVTAHEAALTIAETQITDGSLLARLAAGEVIAGQWTFEDRVDIDNGAALRIHDALDTDYMELSHDGTDLNAAFVNTTDWNLLDGVVLKIWDSTDTDHVAISHTGSNVVIDSQGAGTLFFTGLSTSVTIAGVPLRVRDSGGTDWLDFSHDGTDFNITPTNTAEINIATGVDLVVTDRLDVLGTTASGPIDSSLNLIATAPGISWQESDASADEGVYLMFVSGGTFDLRAYDDAGSSFSTPLQISRSTTTISEIEMNATLVDINASQVDLGVYSFDSDQTVGAGQDNYVLTYDNASGLISLEAAASGSLPADPNLNALLFWDDTGGAADWADTLQVQSGRLRILDSLLTDYGEFYHDGDDFKMEFTNTDDLHIGGVDDVVLLGGTALRIDDAGNTDWVVFSHDGADFNIDATNTTNVVFEGQTSVYFGGENHIDDSNSILNRDLATGGVMDINVTATDGLGNGIVRVNRSLNTTGVSGLYLLRGDGSTSTAVQMYYENSTDDAYLTITAAADATLTFDGTTSNSILSDDTTPLIVNGFTRYDFIGGLVDAQEGLSGSYGINSDTGSTWGANIWALGPSWSGTGATGTSFAVEGDQYGLTWLRDSHASADADALEGLYLWRAGNNYAAIGRTAAKFNTNVYTGTSLYISESAVPSADESGYGQLWVDNVEKVLRFDNEDGESYFANAGCVAQNIQNGNYTLQLSDIGKYISKTSGGAGETITIPANASVDFPNGAMIAIENRGGGNLTIAITSDTLVWTKDGSTGSRTLGDDGMCVLFHVGNTVWNIAGDQLS